MFNSEKQISKSEFETRISSLPFKYPVECPLPKEIQNIIKRDKIPESELRENQSLKESIEVT